MRCKIITTCQRKGGVGKSTSTLNLANVFAERCKRVLIIDLDDQQNTSKSISTNVEASLTIEDLLLKDDVTLNQVTIKSDWDKVFLLPSSANLSGAIKYLDGELGGHLILKEKLTSTSSATSNEYFDFILIDTSPSLNILTINALCASDYMFIPLSSKYFSMHGLQQTIGSFKKVQSRLNTNLKFLGIAIVNHDQRNALANEVVEKIKAKYGKETFNTIIGINIKIEEAQVKKQSILTYASNDRGADQYRKLGVEILNRINLNHIS